MAKYYVTEDEKYPSLLVSKHESGTEFPPEVEAALERFLHAEVRFNEVEEATIAILKEHGHAL